MLRLLLSLCLAASWTCCSVCQNSTSRFQSANNPVQTENINSLGPSAQWMYWGTNTTDLAAVTSLYNSLALSDNQRQELGWTASLDPCGNETCSFLECNWPGITCRSWRITGIDISDSLINNTDHFTGTLPRQLAALSELKIFNASGHELAGTLPAEWSSLDSLEILDLSKNRLTGMLPMQWANMSQISFMNLSANYLTGSIPSAWANLPSLNVLDVSNNNICNSTNLPSSLTVRNGDPVACSALVFAASVPTGAPPSPPPAPATPPQQAQIGQPVLQMSTGINIAVSVVIGAFLLFGIVAGAIRVRRQQNAHRAWIQARMEAQLRQDREEEIAYQKFLKNQKSPTIVLDPRGETLLLGKELENEGSLPKQDTDAPLQQQEEEVESLAGTGDPSAHPGEDLVRTTDNLLDPGQATGSAPAAQPASAPAQPLPNEPRVSGPLGTVQTASSQQDPQRTEGSANRRTPQLLPVGGGEPVLPRRVLEPNVPYWMDPTFRMPLPRRQRTLPMYETDVLINAADEFIFSHESAASSGGGAPSASLASEDTTSSPRRIRGILAGLMPGARDTTTTAMPVPNDIETGLSQDVPSTSVTGGHQNEQVAARVRQRIDELRDTTEPAGEEAADEGPAPPPPIVRWAGLRRMLGMEDEQQRAARLRREVEQTRQISMVTTRPGSQSVAGASRVGSVQAAPASDTAPASRP